MTQGEEKGRGRGRGGGGRGGEVWKGRGQVQYAHAVEKGRPTAPKTK